ncbi:MAG: DNRLRE domain-containing protein, partial [Candidatus Limnocylindrales bacterium]
MATSVQSSSPLVPGSTSNGQGSPTPGATNSTSSVVAVPGVDVSQGGAGGAGAGSGAVALSTAGGSLGGLTSGNTTLRVEPAAASFPQTPTEVASLRDAHHRVVANPNGTLTETTSSSRLNYKTPVGTWQPIDTSLISSGSTSGYNLTERSNNGTIVFNTTSPSDPIAALVGAGFSLSFRVPGLSGSGTTQGTNGLTYGASGGDSSIVLASTADGFEFGAVLTRTGAPNKYSFAVATHGLSLVVAPDGQTIEVVSGQAPDQQLLGVISAPSLFDARGSVAPASAVTVTLDASAAGLRSGETLLTYTVDRAWLAATGRAYPVTLDPTACIAWDATSNCTVNVSGRANGYVDTYVSSAAPDQVGTGTVDRIGVDPTLGKTRSLYYFPHTVLPDGAQIVSATFGVHLASGTASGQHILASAIASTWGGSGATWSTQPSTQGTGYVDTPAATGWVNMDVSQMVRARYTRNNADWQPDFGIELRTADETTPCLTGACSPLAFDSGSSGANEPQLTITYVAPHVKINFDPALGPDYAPTKLAIGSTTTIPVQVGNTGSGYTYNRCGGSTNDCYMVGYRWYDSRGWNVNIQGFQAWGLAELPADLPNQAWSSPINLQVVSPPIAGQYGLRIDLVHIVKTQRVWASDWAYPSLYLARAKDDLTSTNIHVTGQSVISRNDFTVAVTAGAAAGGDPKSVSLPDGSNASIDLATGNMTLSASSGLGFSDLNGQISLSYYYDSAQAGTACDLILGACGWGTNFDERIEGATSGANYTYRDPAGNRYFVSPNANGQLISNAPVKIDRPRITVLDENVVPGWTTTGSGLPYVTTATALNGGHSYALDSANSAGATTSAVNVDINQYPLVGFAVKSTAGGMGVGFQIKNNITGATRWLVYTFGTNFTVTEPNAVQVTLGGDPSSWLVASGDGASGEVYIWSRVVGDSSFGGPNDDYSVVGLGLFGNGTAGTDYIDALRFEPRSSTVFDEPAVSMPSWTSGGTNAVSSTASPAVGSSYLQITPAPASAEPTCSCLNVSLSSTPYVTWYWRKVGGSSVAETFYLHDARVPGTTGSITYYAGPSVPAGVDATRAIQVSATAPNTWTRVTRDLEDDARQLLSMFNDAGVGGTLSEAGGSPTPDPVILDGYALLAVDGSYAGFDWEQMLTQPSLDPTTAGQVSGDDFVVTLSGGETHRFNQAGLLTSIRDLDGNKTTLDWNYDFTTTVGGADAYKLAAIHAPSEGMATGSGAAVRQIDVTYSAGSVVFAERLGTAGATSGRTAEFDIDASGNLVNVVPARHVGACASAGTASGCVGYVYGAGHILTRVLDPRYDGSNSDYTDIAYQNGLATAITPATTGSPLLRVLSFNANPGALYLRPEWQDASAVVNNYAYYADITASGSVYTEYRPIPCSAANCAGGATSPATPSDMLAAYRSDGLDNPTQETRYRLANNQSPIISRRGTLAVAKIDNYPDPLAAQQVMWTQSPDQYVASVTAGNG